MPTARLPSVHYVFIADNQGMHLAFPALKETLATPGRHCVSLIYFTADNRFVFKRELEILSKHFTGRFIVCYETGGIYTGSNLLQEAIEAVLNANTNDQVLFFLYGAEELMYIIKQRLRFLSVPDSAVHEQFLI